MPNTQAKIDIAKAATAGATGLAISFADINIALTTISLVLSISYVTWKWIKDIKRHNTRKDDRKDI